MYIRITNMYQNHAQYVKLRGVSVTLTAMGREVTADDVRKAIELLRRLEKKLAEAAVAASA